MIDSSAFLNVKFYRTNFLCFVSIAKKKGGGNVSTMYSFVVLITLFRYNSSYEDTYRQSSYEWNTQIDVSIYSLVSRVEITSCHWNATLRDVFRFAEDSLACKKFVRTRTHDVIIRVVNYPKEKTISRQKKASFLSVHGNCNTYTEDNESKTSVLSQKGPK